MFEFFLKHAKKKRENFIRELRVRIADIAVQSSQSDTLEKLEPVLERFKNVVIDSWDYPEVNKQLMLLGAAVKLRIVYLQMRNIHDRWTYGIRLH